MSGVGQVPSPRCRTYTKVSFECFVSNVYVWTEDEERVDIPFEHLKTSRVNYPSNCRSPALNSILELVQLLFLQIGDMEVVDAPFK